jgi:acyl-CoA reductase-like NAD-dependent aldehyde dehydrogenase
MRFGKYLTEFTDPALRNLEQNAEKEAKEEAKKLEKAFRDRIDDTMKSLDWFAKETIKLTPDVKEQAKEFNVFVSRLIGFQQDTMSWNYSFKMLDELIDNIEEHAKFIRKKYGWYGK